MCQSPDPFWQASAGCKALAGPDHAVQDGPAATGRFTRFAPIATQNKDFFGNDAFNAS